MSERIWFNCLPIITNSYANVGDMKNRNFNIFIPTTLNSNNHNPCTNKEDNQCKSHG